MPELGPQTRVRALSSVYARPFGNELVLLEFGRGEYFALDEIATEIWRRLEDGDALATVASRVASSHDVSESQAFDDIVSLVRDMHARALVETIDTVSTE